jgi:hypothetical protein
MKESDNNRILLVDDEEDITFALSIGFFAIKSNA